MSFSLSKSVAVRNVFPDYGVFTAASSQDLTLTYTAQKLLSIQDGVATVIFDVSCDSFSGGIVNFSFKYSEGDVLSSAETALKSALSDSQ